MVKGFDICHDSVGSTLKKKEKGLTQASPTKKKNQQLP